MFLKLLGGQWRDGPHWTMGWAKYRGMGHMGNEAHWGYSVRGMGLRWVGMGT